ncbi:14027_t:CDS:2, partial [Racocetra fulgida]
LPSRKRQNNQKLANEQDQRIGKLINENRGDEDENCLEEDNIGEYEYRLEENNIANQGIRQHITEICSDEDDYRLEEDNNYEETL